jgi:putative addiction module component (TIGR02574 family)
MKPIRLSDVLQMPVEERLELVGNIWDGIAQVPEALQLTEAQRVELDRRLEAYWRNPQEGSPWSEVKARIRSNR